MGKLRTSKREYLFLSDVSYRFLNKIYNRILLFSSVAQSCLTICDSKDCSMPGFSAHQQLLELAQTHIHRVGDAIQLSHPLSPLSPPTFTFSQHQVFSTKSHLCISWPKYWSFSFSISPSNEYSGLISFRIDRIDLPVVQRTLRNLLQHYSSKASIIQHSAFFIVQLTSIHDFWNNHSFD